MADTKEDLLKKIEELEAASAQKDKELEEAKTTSEQKTKELEEVKNVSAQKDKELKEAKSIISEQSTMIEKQEEEVQKANVIVTHERKKFKVIGKQFKVGTGENTSVIKAEDLKNHPEVIKSLIEKKSGLLQAL